MAKPAPTDTARLERLLMRWPCSIRLKLALQEARVREARLLRGQIRRALMGADLQTLQRMAEAAHG